MDKVNVIWTFRNGDSSQSSMILQNMLVLATDTEADRNGDEKAKLATTVTLAARPEEAQKVALAAQNGELRLSLRKFGDEEKSSVRALKLVDLIRNTHREETSSSEDNEPVKNPKESSKPVINDVPLLTPESDDGTLFRQKITNGSTQTVVTHRIGGKDDGTEQVEKSNPLIGPKPPSK
jgi:hypothetical protein